MRVKLDRGWKLKGWWPYEWVLGRSKENNDTFDGATPWIDASVPGSVYGDLEAAGLIEDPYYGMNSLKCEWVSQRAWMYRNEFEADLSWKGRNISLVCNGADYVSNFYLNGVFLGRQEGMFTPVWFDVTDSLKYGSLNELVVVIEKAPEEMDQVGYTSRTRTQKARFGYKWDFGTKLVDLGIWKDVELHITGCSRIEDIYIRPELNSDNSQGIVHIKLSLFNSQKTGMTVKLKISDGNTDAASYERSIDVETGLFEVCYDLDISQPKLWYPNGYGEQNLYRAEISISDDKGFLSDYCTVRFGIRKLEFTRNVDAPDGSLPYTIAVNGVKIFLNGWNMVPIDMRYGKPDIEKYRWLTMLAAKANVNLLRIWGGGLIEREELYDLCDEYGIMIWQEFIQSSSGIDNEASVEPGFLDLLGKTAESVIRQKRNHASLTVWCGGNELMDSSCKPLDCSHPNIAMLNRLAKKLSPDRLFLPTSASGPVQWLDTSKVYQGLHHDIHGQWRYLGPEEHYRYYNLNDCLIHTEFGVQGCSSADTIRGIIPEEYLMPANRDNTVWKHHGAAWWHTDKEVEMLFGKTGNLDEFAKYSQFIQAEGLRYIIESNRRREFRCSGVIPWQFNEPWPNAVCTNAVEYCGKPKMAYYWVRHAYSPLHLSLKYDKIGFSHGEIFRAELYLHSTGKLADGMEIIWEIRDLNGNILSSDSNNLTGGLKGCQKAGDIAWKVEELYNNAFMVRLKGFKDRILACSNDYLFCVNEKEFFNGLMKDTDVDIKCRLVEASGETVTVELENSGTVTALYASIETDSPGIRMFCHQNFSCLIPGQKKEYRLELNGKERGMAPVFKVSALNMEESLRIDI